MSPQKISFYDYCIANNKLALLNEWDKGKNGDITPKTLTAKSGKKIWWQCSKGHEWQTAVYNRAYGSVCPYCARKRAAKGINDLASLAPEVADQWHPTKNGDLTPENTPAQSRKKVWWQCKEGHEWQAVVYNRTNGTGCPHCAQQAIKGVNDLATVAPELAAQWHPTLNGGVTPETIAAKSRKKVWWQCSKGHEWQAVVYNRTKGSGCPFCYPKAGKALLVRQQEMLREAKEKLEIQD